MNTHLSLSVVLRRTFGIYAGQATLLLSAAVMVEAALALDRVYLDGSPALAVVALLLNVLVIGLFVCVVVLLVDDVWDGGQPRGARDLLRRAFSALGPLLLVGVVACLAITLLVSIVWFVVFFIASAVLFGAGTGAGALILGLILAPVLLLVPELFLLTIWSVLAAVAVLERPGRLRALGRSRELVRGNGWRVLALILVLAVGLALATGAVERASHSAGSGAAIAAQLLMGTLVAPLPVLAETALYFELRRAEPTPAPADPTPPGAPPPSPALPSL